MGDQSKIYSSLIVMEEDESGILCQGSSGKEPIAITRNSDRTELDSDDDDSDDEDGNHTSIEHLNEKNLVLKSTLLGQYTSDGHLLKKRKKAGKTFKFVNCILQVPCDIAHFTELRIGQQILIKHGNKWQHGQVIPSKLLDGIKIEIGKEKCVTLTSEDIFTVKAPKEYILPHCTGHFTFEGGE